jgi:hypothetical protein
MCVESTCCAELTACNGIPNCFDCFTGANTDATVCGAANITAAFDVINTCLHGCCTTDCGSGTGCNPVTNEPCNTAAGEACDLGQNGFACFPAPNDTSLCDSCDNMAGPFCVAGAHCGSDNTCAHYCCDDGDCGTGTCDKTVMIVADMSIGLCVHK